MSNDQFFVELTSDEWSVQLIAPGGVLVKSVGGLTALSPTRRQGSVLFKDEAGDAELTWLAMNGSTGVIVSKCFKVEVVNYEPVELVYRTFIPCEVVVGPAPTVLTLFRGLHGGDSRYICSPPSSIFGLQQNSYRTSYRATITCDFVAPAGANAPPTTPPFVVPPPAVNSSQLQYYTIGEIPNLDAPFGQTRRYPFASGGPSGCFPAIGTDRCTTLLTGSPTPVTAQLLHQQLQFIMYQGQSYFQIQRANGVNGAFSLRPQANKIIVRFLVNAENPLAPGGPQIDSTFGFEVLWEVNASNGRQRVQVYGSGTHDEFPAHEMYMNGNLLTRWDPAIRGNNVFNLFDSAPSRRATINESFYP